MGQACCTSIDSSPEPLQKLFYVSRDAVEIVTCDVRKSEAERLYTWDSLLKAEAKYCALASGNLFIAGGRDAVLFHTAKSQFKSSNLCFEYNPNSLLISSKPDLTVSRQGHLLLCDSEAVYALAGFTEQMGTKTCEKFEFQSGQWGLIPQMNEVRINAAGCVYKQHIFVTGGFSHLAESPLLTIETFNPSLAHWSICDLKLPSALEKHACAPYLGGILVFGGYQPDDVPNYSSFWLSLSENRVMQKQGVTQEAEFCGQVSVQGDVVYAYEGRSGRRLYIFKDERWTCVQVKISNLSKSCEYS